jgi:hypothetical protein
MQAAVLPYRMNDASRGFSYANTLVEASNTTTEREAAPEVDYDFHRTISETGRRTLMKLGRTMFWKIPALHSAILEQAHLAVSPLTPMFLGADKTWGDAALSWLNNWHKVQCIEGWPYDYESYTELLVSSAIVDGQLHTLLTEDGSGNPRVQMIPAHRIGGKWSTGGQAKVLLEQNSMTIDGVLVDDSLPWTYGSPIEFTANMIGGVIVDGLNKPLAYRVYDDPASSSIFRDISSRSLFPCFFPLVTGQLSGVSLLASSVFDWQDIREFKRFELLAQKAFSTKTIVEHNEAGEADGAKALIQASATFNSTTNTAATLPTQKLEAGTMTYLKARSGSKLEAFSWSDRPGRNSQDFFETSVRDAMRGTEWDAFFSLDPAHVGGAPMRVIVDRINRVLRKRRRIVIKNVLRNDVFALAKGIKNGDLSFNEEWYRWTYQGPPDLTADRRYDAQTDEMEYTLGWSTMEDIEARRNGNWLLKREQREREVDDLYTRARRLATRHGIPIQEAAARISQSGNAFINLGENVADADLKDSQTPVDTKGNPIDTTK